MNIDKIRIEFQKTYDEYADAIFRYCYFQVSDREKAKDLAQDTFLKFWEYVASGKQVEYVKSFLYRIASNTVIDERRKKKTISLEKITENGHDWADEKDEEKQKEIIYEGRQAIETVAKLPEKYRDVLMLRYVDDLSIKEIAKIIDEKENNVSVRINRGLEKLKNILNEGKNNE